MGNATKHPICLSDFGWLNCIKNPKPMKNRRLMLLTLLILLNSTVRAQNTAHYKKILTTVNAKLTQAVIKKDINTLLAGYDANAVCMPEYHNTLFGKEDIRKYYSKWLDSATVSRFQKEIHEIKQVKNFLLTSGTFNEEFTKTGRAPFVYKGKYIQVWKIGKGEGLSLISEIWGAVDNIDRASLPLSQFIMPDTANFPRPAVTPALIAVTARNKHLASLIVKRDGASMADFYARDAIYMPYYMPMLTGFNTIKDYYVQHEDPKVGIDKVSINASGIIDLGAYVLVNGYYDVNWSAGEANGTVTGKSINIWKREPGGRLLLYRQMVCHD
jgi:ketosteroid isomerase-like protein